MIKLHAALAAVSGAALLAGCAATPDLGPRPEARAADSFATSRSFDAPAAAWPSDRWWDAYGDPQLSALIDEALSGSPSLAAASARLRQAEAAAEQQGAALKPSVNASASAQATWRQLGGGDLPDAVQGLVSDDWTHQSSAGLRLDYQLDFFGKNRATLAAATSKVEVAEAEAAAARLQLSTAVALAYADLVRLADETASAAETIRLRTDSTGLVRQRLDDGVENEAHLRQSEAELAQARADLAVLDGQLLRTRRQIAALLGKGPDRGLEIALPARPSIAAPGLPEQVGLNLVGRRPDLAAARRRAEAAAHKIDAARAAFYPDVNLAAVAGLQTLGISSLGGARLTSVQAGPAVSLPIFEGGRLTGAYKGARAEYDEAVALYDQTLADALREVADALGDRRSLEAQLAQSRAALGASEAAWRLTRTRYEGGLASYIDALNVENGLVARRRAVASLEARAFALDVAMVRALGGGFTQS
jgi:NodT family efflux transporter outer membrane factor (OMF) lipoprotein